MQRWARSSTSDGLQYFAYVDLLSYSLLAMQRRTSVKLARQRLRVFRADEQRLDKSQYV